MAPALTILSLSGQLIDCFMQYFISGMHMTYRPLKVLMACDP